MVMAIFVHVKVELSTFTILDCDLNKIKLEGLALFC